MYPPMDEVKQAQPLGQVLLSSGIFVAIFSVDTTEERDNDHCGSFRNSGRVTVYLFDGD